MKGWRAGPVKGTHTGYHVGGTDRLNTRADTKHGSPPGALAKRPSMVTPGGSIPILARCSALDVAWMSRVSR
jgi:hypothetical protein